MVIRTKFCHLYKKKKKNASSDISQEMFPSSSDGELNRDSKQFVNDDEASNYPGDITYQM